MVSRTFDAEWWIARPPTYLARHQAAHIEGADALELAGQLEKIGFFNLPKSLDAGHDKPDATGFGIKISDGSRSHTVEFSGASGGATLSGLIQWLNTRAASP